MAEKVIVLTTSGRISILELKVDKTGSALDDLQRIVGGYIEIVRPIGLPSKYLIVCDEEGVLKNLEVNKAGSLLYSAPIVGDIVIMKDGFRNGEPDIVGMDDEEATILANALISSCPWLKIYVHE